MQRGPIATSKELPITLHFSEGKIPRESALADENKGTPLLYMYYATLGAATAAAAGIRIRQIGGPLKLLTFLTLIPLFPPPPSPSFIFTIALVVVIAMDGWIGKS